MNQNSLNNNGEHQNHFFSNIVITEINESRAEMENNSNNRMTTSTDYLVEEPNDYIFEPGHYPNEQVCTLREDYATSNGSSRIVSETDELLEYEYRSNSHYIPEAQNSTNSKQNNSQRHHLNGIIRGISLSKCPVIGFGFELAKNSINNEDFIYVSSIKSNSPAEFCLQLGDILIELDEMNPCESFASIDEINKYLEDKDNVHLMAIHKTKFLRLKSENEDLKDYSTNCEDIVIVLWNNN